MTFKSLELNAALIQAVEDLGYENPTPIQKEAIPVVLSGVDLMAAAQTGTGKTGGFALPILHRMADQPPAKNKRKQVIPRALILAPTRELAAQIEESFREFGKYLKLKTMVIYGGVSMNPQIQRLQRGVDIIIATPGRLLDLHNQGFVDLSCTETLVLDEADRMLDMGFIDDIRKIIGFMPKERQNLLFSATFSDEIRELSSQILHEPHSIEVAARNSTVELIQQIAHPVARARKMELLIKLIKEHQWYQVLIFTRTKAAANKVSEVLEKNGVKSSALHGNKSQAARTAAMKDFKAGRVQAMVATDIAARGIDIDQLACVINYDLPNNSEDYVHRIGRTGRAGSEGVAISLVTVDEAGFMQQIEKFIHRKVDRVEVEGFTPASTEKAMPIVMGRQVLWGGIGKPPSRRESASHVRTERQNLAPSKPRGAAPSRGRPGGRSTERDEGRTERRIARTPEGRFAGPAAASFDEFSDKPARRRAPTGAGARTRSDEGRGFGEDRRRSAPSDRPARAGAGSRSGFRAEGSGDARPASRSSRPASGAPRGPRSADAGAGRSSFRAEGGGDARPASRSARPASGAPRGARSADAGGRSSFRAEGGGDARPASRSSRPASGAPRGARSADAGAGRSSGAGRGASAGAGRSSSDRSGKPTRQRRPA